MKYNLTLTILLLLFAGYSNGQGTGINHYERKVKEGNFQLPGEQFSNKGFLIAVPDSLYSYGRINVKKMYFNTFHVKGFELFFENNIVSRVQFVISGRKSLDAFIAALKSEFPQIEQRESDFLWTNNGQKFKGTVTKYGGKSRVYLSKIEL